MGEYDFFLRKCDEIRLLSTFADAQGLSSARDHLRMAEFEIKRRHDWLKEQKEATDKQRTLNKLDEFNQLLPGTSTEPRGA